LKLFEEDTPTDEPSAPDTLVTDNPSERLNPYVEDQNAVILPTVMGPPAYGSPDPETSSSYLAPLVDHPLRASFSEDYGADVIEDSNLVSRETGEEVDPDEIGSDVEEEGPPDYESMTVEELKNLARDRGIEGFSQMNKAELIAAHQDWDEAQASVDEEPQA